MTQGRRRFPLGRLSGLPEEVVFYLRSAIYAIFIAAVYWFVSYEVAGTVLLGGFGIASLVLTLYLAWRRPRHGGPTETGSDEAPQLAPDGPFGDDSGAVPAPTYAPLEFAAGLALLVLTIPFGLAMALASVVPLAAGALNWLRAVEAEPAFRTADDDVASPR